MTTQGSPALLVKDAGAPADAPIGVVFPDLPGCTSQGDDTRRAALMAIEALATHAEAMVADGEELPEPSSPGIVPDWLDPSESEVGAHVLVPLELPGRSVRVNITMDEGLLQRVDRAAAGHGFTRSAFWPKRCATGCAGTASRRGASAALSPLHAAAAVRRRTLRKSIPTSARFTIPASAAVPKPSV